MKKLTLKERDEVVTKGYLEDILEQKLGYELDQKLDQKLNKMFNDKFALWSKEMERHVASLIENSDSKFEIFYEGFEGHDVRIRRIERQIEYI